MSPYPGIPKSKTAKMEKCVAHVKAKGGKAKNPYAICHSAIMGKSSKRK